MLYSNKDLISSVRILTYIGNLFVRSNLKADMGLQLHSPREIISTVGKTGQDVSRKQKRSQEAEMLRCNKSA